MDPSTNFYVHLPSNNVSDTGRNKLGRYTTHLKLPIKIGFDWEVALSEISYTKSWYNVSEESFCTVISFGQELENTEKFTKSYETMESTPNSKYKPDETVHINLPLSGSESFNNSSFLDDQTLVDKTGGAYLYTVPILPGHYTIKELIETVNTRLMYETAMREAKAPLTTAPMVSLGPDGLISVFTGKRKNLSTNSMEDTYVNFTGDASNILGFA